MKSDSSTSPFHSPALQKVFNEVSESFNDFNEKRDRISEDIKRLEDFLHSKNIALPIFYDVDSREGLCWDENPKSEQFRLLYWLTDPDFTTLEKKPLIETKLSVRVRMYSHLPAFLREVAKTIDLAEVSKEIRGSVEDT